MILFPPWLLQRFTKPRSAQLQSFQSVSLLQITTHTRGEYLSPHLAAKLLIAAVPVFIAAYWVYAYRSPRASPQKREPGMSSSMLLALGSTLLLDSWLL